VVFKRRSRRTFGQFLIEIFYPRGGWRRAASYVGHRLSRLPDRPERIAKGIAAGVMASFTPFFGLHFVIAALIARGIGGNILAGLLATFFGNPLTFPLIVELSVQLGNWILGQGGAMHFPQVMRAFGLATGELWKNLIAIVTGGDTNWFSLRLFFRRVYLPYMVGGIPLGVAVSVIMYYVSLPLIRPIRRGGATSCVSASSRPGGPTSRRRQRRDRPLRRPRLTHRRAPPPPRHLRRRRRGPARPADRPTPMDEGARETADARAGRRTRRMR
jgi:uncharacterized protein